jgi:hypothetical protein
MAKNAIDRVKGKVASAIVQPWLSMSGFRKMLQL